MLSALKHTFRALPLRLKYSTLSLQKKTGISRSWPTLPFSHTATPPYASRALSSHTFSTHVEDVLDSTERLERIIDSTIQTFNQDIRPITAESYMHYAAIEQTKTPRPDDWHGLVTEPWKSEEMQAPLDLKNLLKMLKQLTQDNASTTSNYSRGRPDSIASERKPQMQVKLDGLFASLLDMLNSYQEALGENRTFYNQFSPAACPMHHWLSLLFSIQILINQPTSIQAGFDNLSDSQLECLKIFMRKIVKYNTPDDAYSAIISDMNRYMDLFDGKLLNIEDRIRNFITRKGYTFNRHHKTQIGKILYELVRDQTSESAVYLDNLVPQLPEDIYELLQCYVFLDDTDIKQSARNCVATYFLTLPKEKMPYICAFETLIVPTRTVITSIPRTQIELYVSTEEAIKEFIQDRGNKRHEQLIGKILVGLIARLEPTKSIPPLCLAECLPNPLTPLVFNCAAVSAMSITDFIRRCLIKYLAQEEPSPGTPTALIKFDGDITFAQATTDKSMPSKTYNQLSDLKLIINLFLNTEEGRQHELLIGEHFAKGSQEELAEQEKLKEYLPNADLLQLIFRCAWLKNMRPDEYIQECIVYYQTEDQSYTRETQQSV